MVVSTLFSIDSPLLGQYIGLFGSLGFGFQGKIYGMLRRGEEATDRVAALTSYAPKSRRAPGVLCTLSGQSTGPKP